MSKHAAIYLRVSSNRQDLENQGPDMKQWAADHDGPVEWYEDKFTGKTMDRPGWKRLETAIRRGLVHTVVVWRIDRMGRTTAEMAPLFADLRDRGVNLVSVRDGFDFSTPSGRFFANMLAAMAEYDNEVRSERTRIGQAKARAAGKTWGGVKPNERARNITSSTKAKAVLRMHADGVSISQIARDLKISRPTIYKIVRTPEYALNPAPADARELDELYGSP